MHATRLSQQRTLCTLFWQTCTLFPQVKSDDALGLALWQERTGIKGSSRGQQVTCERGDSTSAHSMRDRVFGGPLPRSRFVREASMYNPRLCCTFGVEAKQSLTCCTC
jgi:hypothetical protein